jgi:hypothetical protein
LLYVDGRHTPLFKHGDGRQGDTWISHRLPVKPGGQIHICTLSDPRIAHVPLFAQVNVQKFNETISQRKPE